jgi:hypothetical protein
LVNSASVSASAGNIIAIFISASITSSAVPNCAFIAIFLPPLRGQRADVAAA